MQRLEYNQWSVAESLLSEEIPFVVICMHFQRRIMGDIWVDSLSNPSTVIADFNRDAYAFGKLESTAAQEILSTISASMLKTPGLREALRQAWGSFAVSHVVKHEHRSLPTPKAIPDTYRLEQINTSNIAAVQELWKEHYHNTIGDFFDIRDFLHNGFGGCVIHIPSGKCVSACAAISVSRERCDFGLDTLPEHQGYGLATACSYLAVAEALRRKKRPIWITEHDNLASMRVAQKLGFIKTDELAVFKRLLTLSS